MSQFDQIAKAYVQSLGEVLEGFQVDFINPRVLFTKYYYDLIFVTLDGNIPQEPPIAGGAQGFTIDKQTFAIEVLTAGEVTALEEQESTLENTYHRLKDIQENNGSLLWLKEHYQLDAPTLLRIKKALLQVKFTKKGVIEELNQLIATHR